MSFETTKQISYLSLLHDIYYIVNSMDLNYDKIIFFNPTFLKNEKNFNFILKNLTKNKLETLPLNEPRILGELIIEAEKISLASEINGTGELSPLKSIFTQAQSHDYFFNASEISENILLGTKKSKKDLYFAPSYLVSSFMDEFKCLAEQSSDLSINTLYFLIKKYFWSISLAHHGDDFSFSIYSHAKMTCAIACALYQYLNEHHNNIFISQNITVIREILQNPTEPRFLFVKLTCENKKEYSHFSSKHLLLWASHIIINTFNLFVPSIFNVTNDYSVLILPNIDKNKLNKIITDLNNHILTETSEDIYLSASSFETRKNDIFPHFSSSRNASSFIFGDIIRSTAKTDASYLNSHYDYFFTPQPAKKTEDQTCLKTQNNINSLMIPVNTGKLELFNYREKKQDKKNEIGFEYFFNPGITLTQQKNSSIGYLLDSIDGNEADSYPKITIIININNPESHLPYYPNLSILNTLFTLTELITQMGIKNILNQSKTTFLNGFNNTISFHAKPLSLKKILREVYDYYHSVIGSCEYLSILAHIQTEPNENNEYIKLNIMNKENLVFVFNNFLKWEQVFEILDQAEFLSNFYEKCDNTVKKHFLNFIKSTLKNKFFNVSHLLNSIDDKDIYEYFVNVNNPFLLTKLIDMIIKKE